MADLSKEPSMEDILSSIKRIIAEEGEEAATAASKAPVRARGEAQPRPEPKPESRPEPRPEIDNEGDEILELTDSVADPVADSVEALASRPGSAADDGILSVASEVSARLSLAALSTMLVKPQPGEENTLEGLVRTMLRPMLKEWLDARLPGIVEDMVAKEISRITGR